jgi:peptidyl-prolyl cis-trans isomerase A (cyclophilin A)
MNVRAVAAALVICTTVAQAAPAEEKPLKPGLYVILNTSEGEITAQLYEKDVPNTIRNFVGLAQGTKPWLDPATKTMVRRPLYENITFHRVIPEIMIQTGDPTGKGNHNCGIHIQDEFLPGLTFDHPGRLAMANTGSPNSGGCQFFITNGPMSQWTGKYTVFGQVVRGQNVADKINRQPVREEKPVQPALLKSVSIIRVTSQKQSGK